MEPMRGDVIKFSRAGYKHYAIYIGADVAGLERIIHWWTEDNAVEPRIRITPFQDLAASLKPALEERPTDGNLVADRAIAFMQCVDARLAEGNNYKSLFDDNKHFAKWCCNGLGETDIDLREIRNVRDPWRFVHGSVTNNLAPSGILDDNEKLLGDLHPGEIIRFCHQDYEHWAFYLGEQEGVHNVIHWWDRDSVDLPGISIAEFETVAGHCKAEIDSYTVSSVVNVERAVLLANEFGLQEQLVPNDLFDSSKQFAFWCRFGLGLSGLQQIPYIATAADLMDFVNGLKARGNPDLITREHNNMIEEQLDLGDVITLSQDSRQYFAVCIDVELQDRKHVIRWLENGCPSMMVDLFQTAAQNKKAMPYKYRAYLENVINRNEMVRRASALRARVNNDEEDYNGLFSNSKHFALWVFDKYGPNDAHVTVPEIENFPDIWQHVYGFMKSKQSKQNKVLSRRQNKRVLDALKEGDLVRFHRSTLQLIRYQHFAVYIGKCENSGALSVIHWIPDPTDHSLINPKASIRTEAFWTVASYDVTENGNDLLKEHSAYDGDEVVRRAQNRQRRFQSEYPDERRTYNLFTYNCEHFACECRYGKPSSRQVMKWVPFTAE